MVAARSMKAAACWSVLWVTQALLSQAQGGPVGSAFTYQGRLSDNGVPANGIYDFQFSLFGAPNDINSVSGPMAVDGTQVTDGLFVEDLDFGPEVFTGDERWLQIAVRATGSGEPFTALWPRQKLTATPHALMAATARAIDLPFYGVAQADDPTVYFENAGAGPALHAEAADGAAVMAVSNGPANTLFAANAGPGPTAIFLGGNVGVGTPTPEEKLTVNGTIYSRSGGVKFPDGSVQLSAVEVWTLPYVGALAGSNATAFSITQNGTGKAAHFSVNNPDSYWETLTASNNGTGPTVYATHTGTGTAGQFQILNTNNAFAAVSASTNGAGAAVSGTGGANGTGLTGTASGAGRGVFGSNSGTGSAGFFQINNANNSQPALKAQTNGSGAAMYALNTGSGDGIYAQTSGGGDTVFGYNLGATGHAGFFRNENVSNPYAVVQAETSGSASAVYARNTGQGAGLDVEGGIKTSGGIQAAFTVCGMMDIDTNSIQINHPLCDGHGNATIIITPKSALVIPLPGADESVAPPAYVDYVSLIGKWVIVRYPGTSLVPMACYHVLVINHD